MVSHTTTGEWQSFEERMRRRRADRLVLRAEAAVEAGCLEDAQQCIAEARALVPHLPALDAVEQKLTVLPADVDQTAPRSRVAVTAVSLAVASAIAVAAWIVVPRSRSAIDAATAAEVTPPQPASQRIAAASVTPEPLPPPVERFTSETERAAASATALSASASAAMEPASAPTAAPDPLPAARSPAPTPTAETPTATPEVEPKIPAISDTIRFDAFAIANRMATVSTPPPAEVAPATMPVPASSLELPSAAATTKPLPEPAPEPSQEPAVRSVLDRYAAAYSALDVDAAQRVWPAVNRGALARAFDGLASQQVSLGDCRIQVGGTSATAHCAGSTSWSPKVGDGSPRSEPRTWTFELARGAAGWEIVSARVQNR
jgi:hypothetical protein